MPCPCDAFARSSRSAKSSARTAIGCGRSCVGTMLPTRLCSSCGLSWPSCRLADSGRWANTGSPCRPLPPAAPDVNRECDTRNLASRPVALFGRCKVIGGFSSKVGGLSSRPASSPFAVEVKLASPCASRGRSARRSSAPTGSPISAASNAEGGVRTHKPFRAQLFESCAYSGSATSAHRGSTLRHPVDPTRGLAPGNFPSAQGLLGMVSGP